MAARGLTHGGHRPSGPVRGAPAVDIGLPRVQIGGLSCLCPACCARPSATLLCRGAKSAEVLQSPALTALHLYCLQGLAVGRTHGSAPAEASSYLCLKKWRATASAWNRMAHTAQPSPPTLSFSDTRLILKPPGDAATTVPRPRQSSVAHARVPRRLAVKAPVFTLRNRARR
jgi:hypothetical protein